jgi:hypothetical protein
MDAAKERSAAVPAEPGGASEAMCTSSFSVSSVNSPGASVWRTITPIISPAREMIGTATID